MSDPRDNIIRLPLRASTPCCGPGDNLAFGYMFGSKIYLCRNCLQFVERKDALLSLRKARALFREIVKDAFVRFEEIPSSPKNMGDTVKFQIKS